MATQHVTPYGGLANTPQPATPTHQQPQSLRAQKRLAQGLGWFSIGLGLVEVIAPRALGRLIGVRKHTTLVRLFGFREIANGIGIISTRRPAGWMWARVAGDAMDLACLSAAVAATGRRRRTRGVAATAAVAG